METGDNVWPVVVAAFCKPVFGMIFSRRVTRARRGLVYYGRTALAICNYRFGSGQRVLGKYYKPSRLS